MAGGCANRQIDDLGEVVLVVDTGDESRTQATSAPAFREVTSLNPHRDRVS
jgi:hypothetical protein